jgi:hypothetical protein
VPGDRYVARWFLRGLVARFEQAGLPTWQIDPRQPRALDNLIETADGAFVVVDLESGLVSPLASLGTWRRALRRGLVPFYDEVFYDVTRAYVAREEPRMRAVLDDSRFAGVVAALDEAEAATGDWHAGEPRLWGRLERAVWIGLEVRAWRRRLRTRLADSRERGLAWIDRAIATWVDEERLSREEAALLRRQVANPTFQTMLPYLGAHILLGVPLRFPLGSIVRPLLVLGALAAAGWRRATGKDDQAAWAVARDLHAPLVMVLAAVPGAGSFAYLAAKPVRANRLLLRALADAALRRLPFRAYERSGLRRLVARPPAAGARASPAAWWNESRSTASACAD